MQVLEKILQEIEERKLNIDKYRGATLKALAKLWNSAIDTVAEIIRSHMEDDGWIPVGEKLPELNEFVIITDKNGHVTSDICYGYAENDDSEPIFHRWDNEMWQCYTPDVIAWQPLPAPYQPKEENDEI